jgi:Protein of unknown function (DUF3604)
LKENRLASAEFTSQALVRVFVRVFVCFLGIVLWQAPSVVHAQTSVGTQPASRPAPNPLRNAYFGDLHVHTSYSLDAFATGNRNDPRVAYRYGRGDTVTLVGGTRNHLKVPLDFMAVTDHDIWLGELSLCQDPGDPAYNTDACRELRFSDQDVKPLLNGVFMKLLPNYFPEDSSPAQHSLEICGAGTADANKCFNRARSIWQQIQRNADEFYQPGKFTTFSAFEWTAGFKRFGMLHRNVIFRGGHLPDQIFSAVEFNNTPERLWDWLQRDCTGDCQVISIPHNTNYGWGIALAAKNSDGTPFTTEGLRQRAKTEPIIEIHQNKGNSECLIGLGNDDEQCNFEQLFKPCQPGEESRCAVASNYVRNALKTGLMVEDQLGVNPFKYGFIGSSDTHSATPGATESEDWHGAFGLNDATPEGRLHSFLTAGSLNDKNATASPGINPGGLAAVWAAENTRESIFDALKRRESFATSGSRIRVRFFGGWNYPNNLDKSRDWVEQGYKNGVPMGGDLPSKPSGAKSPRLAVWAMKDAGGANLQKIQIIKGWAEGDQTHELVYDVACSDGLKPDRQTHRCADNSAQVNLADCSYSTDKGAAELSTTWSDPDFKPADRAFYYVRVLENPTCRWSTYDAARLKIAPPADGPTTVQQRAWSSPIWYTPAGTERASR